MGKLRRGRKNQQARLDPLKRKGKPAAPKNSDKDEKTRQSRIVPLIEKLASSSPNDRSMALGAITVLCEDPRMRTMFLKEKLVSINLEQCLNDDNDEIAVEAFGLLRNLAIDEGYDVIRHCWRSDVWSKIEAALNKINSTLEYLKLAQPTDSDPKKKDDRKVKELLFYDYAEHVLSLVVIIASGSDDLYQSVFERLNPVLDIVLGLISFNVETSRLPYKLYNTLLDFLYEFSSESAEFVQIWSQSNFPFSSIAEYASSPAQDKNKLGRIYVEGLRFHINEVSGSHVPKDRLAYEILHNLFSNLNGISLEDIKKCMLPSDNANQPVQTPQDKGNPQDINQQIAGVSEDRIIANTNLQAIEVVIDLTTTIWEYLAFNENSPGQPVVIPSDLIQLIFEAALPSILELVRFNSLNDHILGLTDKLVVCLNNLAWLLITLEAIPVEWFENSARIWDLMIDLTHTDDIVLQKDCLSVCWAIAKALGPEVKSKINSEMVDGLIAKCRDILQVESSKEEDAEKLDFFIAAVGLSGTVAPVIEDISITKKISDFLFSSLDFFLQHDNGDSKRAELIIEIISLFFEIFGDKTYPYDYEVFVQGNCLEKLKLVEPEFKALYKKLDKNKNIELKLRAQDTLNNLGRFIQYKQKERQSA